MNGEAFLAVVLFSVAMSATPGPNNAMLMASGVNFGFRRSLPHLFGVTAGVVAMLLAVGLGLGALFERWSALHVVLQVVGAGYLLVLAWRLARSGGLGAASARAQPMSFAGAAAFQLANPKAWVMTISAVTAYTPPDHFALNLLIVAATFALVGLPSTGMWTAFGVALRRWLREEGRIRRFNWAMAALLVLSLIPVLLG
ncbi:MAG TPA: LysE family translocator [Thermomicrobiales bacterium]|jgi:threonine/homoserine/homoserine lactone efflux protein|nr:LysE family translocator [Thermomicrobiales bacterium]